VDAQDFEPYAQYLRQVTDDHVRVAILVTHALVEELIESVIAEAVPKSECFDVPNMRFSDKLKVIRALDTSMTESAVWPLIQHLNKLRNAAAHKDYQSKREKGFADLEKALLSTHPNTILPDQATLLNVVAALCFEHLTVLKNRFRT
jgi:hypothetical protein